MSAPPPRKKSWPAEDPHTPLKTLTAWASRTHQTAPLNATNKELQRAARGIYDAMAPTPKLPALDKTAQRAHIGKLQEIHAAPDIPVKIAPQSQDDRDAADRSSPARHLQRHPNTALTEFAYRFRPDDKRKRDKKGRSGRLTVNMNPERSQEVASALGGLLSDKTANPNLRALKVMGPANIGQRVDDAVLYLRGHDERGGKVVAANLEKALEGTPDALVNHGPPGMLRVGRGISYAETAPGDSSSHGSARKKIVASAVEDLRKIGGGDLQGHVSYRAFRSGYNPNVPSHALPTGRAALMKDIPAAAAKRWEKQLAHQAMNNASMQKLGVLSRGVGEKGRAALLKSIPAAAAAFGKRRGGGNT